MHCAGGYRASVAASFLSAAGRPLVAIDDSFDNAREVSLPPRRPGRLSMTLAIAVAAGLLIGLALGALGGGGSILAVPVLVYLLDQSAAQATTGSLVVVGLTSAVGAFTAWRNDKVLLARGVTFGLVAIGGATVGALASSRVPEPVLLGSFAALLVVVASVMVTRQVRSRRADRRDGYGDGGAHRHVPAVRRPDHHLQPDLHVPVPAGPQGARHGHGRRAAHRVPRRRRRVPRRTGA